MFEKPSIGQELLDVPMGEMIKSMAFAIAEAQMRLDENSIDVAQMMGGLRSVTDEETGDVTFQDSRVYFGKEKISSIDAINLFNASSDVTLKELIKAELNVPSNKIRVRGNTVATLSPDNRGSDPSKVYVVGQDHYVYTGTDSQNQKTYKLVTKESVEEIIVNDTTAANNFTTNLLYILIPSRVSMLELGFSPTFYQFVDTIIEVKISISYTQSGHKSSSSSDGEKVKLKSKNSFWQRFKGGKSKNKTITTSQVNASYSQRFSYTAEGSSLLRTKLVPIPPPAILEERIRQQMALMNEGSLPVAPPEA